MMIDGIFNYINSHVLNQTNSTFRRDNYFLFVDLSLLLPCHKLWKLVELTEGHCLSLILKHAGAFEHILRNQVQLDV